MNKNIHFRIKLLLIVSFILFVIYKLREAGRLYQECPNLYKKAEIYPKRYKARLVKKNERNGEGIKKPGVDRSIDLNNQGEILHIAVSKETTLKQVFDGEFWDYVVEGDSIIKARNSYQLKVVRANTVKIFDIDCEAYKKELENKNK